MFPALRECIAIKALINTVHSLIFPDMTFNNILRIAFWTGFPFSLKHFSHLSCIVIVLKRTITVYTSLRFQIYDQIGSIFFGHFKISLVYDQRMTEKINPVSGHV